MSETLPEGVSGAPPVHIGTSGWSYPHWRGSFYPGDLPVSKWLRHYAGIFSTLEVNATFYHTMKPSTAANWRRETPDGFLWAVKASRVITHIRRLREVGESLERFFGSIRPLEDGLGPVLFQLPPGLIYDGDVVAKFFDLLPRDLRFAIEARHPSWTEREALAHLRSRGIAWCISDTAGRYPFLEAVTADFAYVRLHGSTVLYASCYTEGELQRWAARIGSLGVETFLYFDNDSMAWAPQNALRLREILS